MKTIEEKAEEYAKNKIKGYNDYFLQPQFNNAKTDFAAGYKAAFEWISVDDELPKNETPLIAKNNYGGVLNYNYVFYETTEERDFKLRYTHWRPINND